MSRARQFMAFQSDLSSLAVWLFMFVLVTSWLQDGGPCFRPHACIPRQEAVRQTGRQYEEVLV